MSLTDEQKIDLQRIKTDIGYVADDGGEEKQLLVINYLLNPEKHQDVLKDQDCNETINCIKTYLNLDTWAKDERFLAKGTSVPTVKDLADGFLDILIKEKIELHKKLEKGNVSPVKHELSFVYRAFAVPVSAWGDELGLSSH